MKKEVCKECGAVFTYVVGSVTWPNYCWVCNPDGKATSYEPKPLFEYTGFGFIDFVEEYEF